MAQPAPFHHVGAVTPVPVPNQGFSVPPGSDQMPIDSALSATPVLPAKRKRIEDGEIPVASQITDKDDLIKAYFHLIQRHDNHKLLQVPVPVPEATETDEPALKRQKSEVPSTPPASITDKVGQNEYQTLEALVRDAKLVVDTHIGELEASYQKEPKLATRKTIDEIQELKKQSIQYLRREYGYPSLPKIESSASDVSNKTHPVLVVSTDGATRQLYSSLVKDREFEYDERITAEKLREAGLPKGISTTEIHEMPYMGDSRPPMTLGEAFPRPKKFVTLPMPPMLPMIPGNVLKAREADPFDGVPLVSSYYFTQNLSAGHYLDYSKTGHVLKKVSPTMKLAAGVSDEEVENVERLLRSAFSSFAPSKDNARAVVPTGTVSQVLWQRSGVLEWNKLAEKYDDKVEAEVDMAMDDEIDLEAIEKGLADWDDNMIDPALEAILNPPPKPENVEDRDVDELLDEVTDLIASLASHQRIRNGMPVSAAQMQVPDALTNVEPAVPTPEEMEAYEALKDQLALIISKLPPYAVAKLGGDQLEDLLVNTKVRVPGESIKGVMDDDPLIPKVRPVQPPQPAPVPTPSHIPSRTGSRASGTFINHQPQFAAQPQYNQGRQSISTPGGTPYYGSRPAGGQTPVPVPVQSRQSSIAMSQHMPSPVPHRTGMSPAPQQQPHHVPPSQQVAQGYRQTQPANFPPYAQQLAKIQTPYGHQAMPQQFNAGPRQQPPPAGYQQGSPNTGFRQPSYSQQGFQPQQVPPQGGPPPPQSPFYQNGVPSRTASPQVPQQFVQQAPSGQFPIQRFNGPPSSGMAPGSPQVGRGYMMTGQPQHIPPVRHMPSPSPGPGTPSSGVATPQMGYHGGAMPMDPTPAHMMHISPQQQAQQAQQAQQQQQMYQQQMKGRALSSTPQPPPSMTGTPVNGVKGPQSRSGSVTPAARPNGTPIIPHKVTPVPLPVIPGLSGGAQGKQ